MKRLKYKKIKDLLKETKTISIFTKYKIRCPELESWILENSFSLTNELLFSEYMKKVVKKINKKYLERMCELIKKGITPIGITDCIKIMNKPNKLIESKISNSFSAYAYAENVIKGRWPKGEKIILEESFISIEIEYAKNIIKNRWPEFEKQLIAKKQWNWVKYYIRTLGKRIPELEALINSENSQ